MPRPRRLRRGVAAPEETVVQEPVAPLADETVVVDEAVPAGPPMPPAPYEEPPPNREIWPWLLVLLGLVLAGIAAAYFATNHKKKHQAQPATTAVVTTAPAQTVAPLPPSKPPKIVEIAVPKVTGLQAPEALQALQKANLVGTTKGAFSDKPKNEVLAQDPAPTTKVKKGSTVTLTVSKGKQSVPVPDVVGQDADA